MTKFKNWYAITPKEKIERWANALRVLRGLSRHAREKHFNMVNWGVKTECGTIACAAGHCGMDPWFVNQGFKLIPQKVSKGINLNCAAQDLGRINVNIEDFFGMMGSDEIFYNSTQRRVIDVIEEIKEHIKYIKLEEKHFNTKFEEHLEQIG